jgi:hypothetical protein
MKTEIMYDRRSMKIIGKQDKGLRIKDKIEEG